MMFNFADDEDAGWMLSAYCGAEVLKKEHFYNTNHKKSPKTDEKVNVQKETCNDNGRVDVNESICNADNSAVEVTEFKESIVSDNNDRRLLDTQVSLVSAASSENLIGDVNEQQTSAVANQDAPVLHANRKRTASYAFVSSEPESNNNKTLYDDAYASSSGIRPPKVPVSDETFTTGNNTYEDKDYIFENPYLVEYRGNDYGSEWHEGSFAEQFHESSMVRHNFNCSLYSH